MNKRISKIFIFILTPLAGSGIFYIADNPQMLSIQLIRRYNLNQQDLNLSFTYFYIASFFALLITPLLLNKLNGSIITLIGTSLIYFGSVFTVIGNHLKKYSIFLLGRGLIGPGSEIFIVGKYVVLEYWFKDNYFTLASGFTESLNLLAGALGTYTTLPIFLKKRDLNFPFIVGSLISFGSCLAAYFIYIFDKEESIDDELEEEEVTLKINIKDCFNKKFIYSNLLVITIAIYYQFLALCIEIFEFRFYVSPLKSKDMASGLMISTMISTLLYGFLIQRLSRKPLFSIISSVMLITSFLMFLCLKTESLFLYIAIFLFSQGFSIIVTLIIPAASLSIPSRSVGFGLTLQSILYACIMSFMSYFTGFIVKKYDEKSFNNILIFFLVCSIIVLIFSLLLYLEDENSGRLLALREDDDRVKFMRNNMEKTSDFVSDASFSLDKTGDFESDASFSLDKTGDFESDASFSLTE